MLGPHMISPGVCTAVFGYLCLLFKATSCSFFFCFFFLCLQYHFNFSWVAERLKEEIPGFSESNRESTYLFPSSVFLPWLVPAFLPREKVVVSLETGQLYSLSQMWGIFRRSDIIFI